ncbi:MAG: VWA domain-containing protein [Chloroflexia bacterium]|nr:VWA domain-containing protein [Chloroflexia bacterium]
MTNLVWARPDALWLLLLVPLFAVTGAWWGVRRGRLRPAELLWRLAVVALLAVGLAEPLIASGAGSGGAVFVVDRSESISADVRDAADRWLIDALSAAPSARRAAIVTFGAKPELITPPSAAIDAIDADPTSPDGDAVDPSFTDIDAGLGLARALPLGGGRRIVLISDGGENIGQAIDQAAQAALEGVPIDTLTLPGVSDADLRVDGISAPTSAWEGEPITVLAGVETGRGGTATVELLVDGVVKDTAEADLAEGLSSRAFTLDDLAPGFHALEVRVRGDAETNRRTDDDQAPHGIVVRNRPRILLIVPEGADPGIMQGILQRGGTEVTVTDPAGIPSRLSELGAWDGFVLDNVPAAAMTFDQVAGLREATRSLGRGLVVIGGTASYGPGGYAGTPLEEALPVTVKVTDGRERQRIALLLIMDKSGSMGYDPLGGKGKIEMAKEAVRLAARSLAEGDQVGLIVFNDRQEWVVPLTTIGDEASRAAIDRKIAAIEPDGGTEILPALSVGLDAIRNADADARHIVLLSDGKARTGTRESYQHLLDDALSDRTTLSTIAIGEDADTDLLNFLADEGGGRYHFTVRDEDIPQVTLEEARSAGSQSVIRGGFRPIQTAPSPILAAFDPESLPDLAGYDFAEAKPDAQVILTSDREDPVLAKWQFGLGRVIAWTADNGSDLAAPWSLWEGYDEFWAAAVRWALPDPERRPLTVSTERDGADVVLTVAAAGESGDFADFLPTFATVTSATGEPVVTQEMTQTAPGEYTLRLPAPAAGAYAVDVRQERSSGPLVETAGITVPPSPETLPAPGGPALLASITARTGGRVLSLDDPGAVWNAPSPGGSPLREHRAVWYIPIGLALALFVADIATRMGVWPLLRRLIGGSLRA